MVARTEMVGVGWSELPFGLGQRPRAVRNAYPQPFASAPGTSARQHSRTTVLAEAAPPQNDCWLASMPPSGPVRFTGLVWQDGAMNEEAIPVLRVQDAAVRDSASVG
jgi:hypothetical protein